MRYILTFLMIAGMAFSSSSQPLNIEQRLGRLPENILNGEAISQSDWVGNAFNFKVSFCNGTSKEFSWTKEGGISQTLVSVPAQVRDEAREAVEAKFREDMTASNAKSLESIQRIVVSPDHSMVAFVQGNNLYIYRCSDASVTQLTSDGTDVIKNGFASWVYYEEILGRPSNYIAFWWSPDSRTLAWYRFDETNVPVFPIVDYDGQYGKLNRTRYPKAGDENPKVEIWFASIQEGSGSNGDSLSGGAVNGGLAVKKCMAQFNSNDDHYFGTPFWNADGSGFIVPWMPREQNELVLHTVNPLNGTHSSIYNEKQMCWIDWMEDMQFTSDGFYVIRDTDGWQNIYFQSFDGKQFLKITDGRNWSTQFVKVDTKGGYIYFTARRESSLRHDFYKVSLKGVSRGKDGSFRTGKITRLTEGEYDYRSVRLSDDNNWFSAVRSSCNTPYQLVAGKCDGKGELLTMWNCKGADFDKYLLPREEILTIEVDGYTIPARVIWPVNMKEGEKYPVIIDMYGGPDAGTVFDEFAGAPRGSRWSSALWWAYDGFIRVCIDHRASGHCGKEGLEFLHRNLLNIEFKDYIEWVKKLYEYPCVNREKIGITGFSYGGSMTTLAVAQYGEYFRYGIAGGGVYDYRLYDTHYTERYMDTPQSNPEGYANTVASGRIANYKGDSTNYLKITHGTSDDNVHIQNTMHLIKAMQDAGKQFDLMIYPGQFHGYRGAQGKHSKVSDIIFWYRHLKGEQAPDALLESIK